MAGKEIPSALVVLNGPISDGKTVRAAAARVRRILCADGGLKNALRLGLTPDFVVGDMDSIPRRRLPRMIYRCDFDQERSDFEKILRLACAGGLGRLFVAGALGGRLDHTLVNLALCRKYSRRLEIILLESGQARLLGPGKCRPRIPRGSFFSLLAAPAAVATLKGARYQLDKDRLEPGSRGLSNVSKGNPSLTVHSGTLWLITPGGAI